MIDCSLRYIACSPNYPETEQDKIDVFVKLLDLGAIPKMKIQKTISSVSIMHTLEKAGLISRLEPFGIIDAKDISELEDYKIRTGA